MSPPRKTIKGLSAFRLAQISEPILQQACRPPSSTSPPHTRHLLPQDSVIPPLSGMVRHMESVAIRLRFSKTSLSGSSRIFYRYSLRLSPPHRALITRTGGNHPRDPDPRTDSVTTAPNLPPTSTVLEDPVPRLSQPGQLLGSVLRLPVNSVENEKCVALRRPLPLVLRC